MIGAGVHGSGAARAAAAAVLALALPAVPLGVAAAGRTAAPLVLAAGAAAVALLAAWIGPVAWPAAGRAAAVERVLVTAVIAWAAALDAAVAGMALRGGEVSRSPIVIAATAAAYAAGSAWSLHVPSEVWWRWPAACTGVAAIWIGAQAAA